MTTSKGQLFHTHTDSLRSIATIVSLGFYRVTYFNIKMSHTVETIRRGLSEYGWRLVEEQGCVVITPDSRTIVSLRLDGECIIIEMEHGSMRLAPEIIAAIAAIESYALDSDARNVQELRQALEWITTPAPRDLNTPSE